MAKLKFVTHPKLTSDDVGQFWRFQVVIAANKT